MRRENNNIQSNNFEGEVPLADRPQVFKIVVYWNEEYLAISSANFNDFDGVNRPFF